VGDNGSKREKSQSLRGLEKYLSFQSLYSRISIKTAGLERKRLQKKVRFIKGPTYPRKIEKKGRYRRNKVGKKKTTRKNNGNTEPW